MIGIVEWSVGEIKLNHGRFCFAVKIELGDSVIKQQKGGYRQESEAKKAREEVIGALYNGKYAIFGNTTVRDFYEFWLEKIKKQSLSYHAYNSYKNSIQNYIIPLYGNLSMGNLRKKHLKRVYQKAYNKHPSVAKIVKTVLNTSLKYAFRHGYVEEDYVTGLKWSRQVEKSAGRKNKRALNLYEINQLYELSKDTVIGLPVMFAVFMGMRRGEIVGAKYSDIDYESQMIYIQRQLGRNNKIDRSEVKLKTYTKQEVPLKTPSSKRRIKIPDIVFNTIMEERSRYERRRNRRKREFQDLNFIYCSSYGRPRTSNYLGKQLHEFVENHDLPYMNWQILRCTYATTILKAGYSLSGVSKTLGHSTKEFTADHYVDMKELIRDFQSDMVAKVLQEEQIIWDYGLTKEMENLLEDGKWLNY